jgi:hypothetical protein
MEKEIYAIAVFTDGIKGTVKFSEDSKENRIKIELNITGYITFFYYFKN